jgi:hypothetical protein
MDDLGKGQSVPGRQSDTALPGVNRLTKAPIDLPAFVRQRLLNLANLSKQDFGLLLTKYALEHLLYRL